MNIGKSSKPLWILKEYSSVLTRLNASQREIDAENLTQMTTIIDDLQKDIVEKIKPDDDYMLLINLLEGKKLEEWEYNKLQLLFQNMKININPKRVTENYSLYGDKDTSLCRQNLLQIIRSFTSGSVDCERLFSFLKIIVTRLRSSMSNARKENLMILSFNRNVQVEPAKISNRFRLKFDDRMKKFVKMKEK